MSGDWSYVEKGLGESDESDFRDEDEYDGDERFTDNDSDQAKDRVGQSHDVLQERNARTYGKFKMKKRRRKKKKKGSVSTDTEGTFTDAEYQSSLKKLKRNKMDDCRTDAEDSEVLENLGIKEENP